MSPDFAGCQVPVDRCQRMGRQRGFGVGRRFADIVIACGNIARPLIGESMHPFPPDVTR